MQPVTFSKSGFEVTAHTRRRVPSGMFEPITTLLVNRGVDYTIGFDTGGYIDARLPDGSFLLVGPQYADYQGPDRTGPQDGWFAGWLEVGGEPTPLYDSQPGQHDHQHGTDPGPLLACINEHLDRRGVPSKQEVQERLVRAESLLHRAGFVPTVHNGVACHRLPAAMLDPGERRTAVTRAADYLRAEGFGVNYPADLTDWVAERAVLPSRPLAGLGGEIAKAGHTEEVVAALSVLTAPGDGVLDQAVDVLHQTAAWWEGLNSTASDPHYAARLREIANRTDSYVREIRALRGDLADRHAAHPQAAARSAASGHDPRVAAALASSPASERTLTGHHAETLLAAPPPAADRPAGRIR
ncbi:hypothetical protein [Streptomyces sp. TLI_171]|uniref:hypothetical protein n=1 Tax=Streptomyces sp. TLI_171 TaxID=1938859 RepID=UPI000C18209A|nr:hypothetical protein [Streptomyces sp. TLI_171]RKE22017.1 hypothetical protein BX266_5427 [Streptomyces sp. TLI_171]